MSAQGALPFEQSGSLTAQGCSVRKATVEQIIQERALVSDLCDIDVPMLTSSTSIGSPQTAPMMFTARQVNGLIEEFEDGWKPSYLFLSQFVHDRGISEQAAVLGELVRVDVDRRYAASVPVDIEQYFAMFPSLWVDHAQISAIAFEDFRARISRGLAVSRTRWQVLPSVAEQTWFRDLENGDGRASATKAISRNLLIPNRDSDVDGVPKIGQPFGDFFLLKLLGRGAFSEVFLARQDSLASRYVAVKVVKRVLSEPASLARLQHTGIVPLYSLHQISGYSVLCMPYAGSATLADWLRGNDVSPSRRQGQGFVETLETSAQTITVAELQVGLSDNFSQIESETELTQLLEGVATTGLDKLRTLEDRQFYVWLASKLASALSHAHLRGIVHGDLKPANILIRNDGEPALIDFNLSQPKDLVEQTVIGGTLPYMAPEQLRSLISRQATSSPASDVFSLGIILYEVIEGRLPFAVSPTASESDLSAAISSFSTFSEVWTNRHSSPGLRAIIGK